MGFRDYNSGLRNVCLNCQERHHACHDSCEKYIDAKNEWESRKKQISEARSDLRVYDDYKLERIISERKSGVNKGKIYKFNGRR